MEQRKIQIQAGSVTAEAILNDSKTADMVWRALPIEGGANTWGDEIYFDIPLSIQLDNNARERVDVGDLGYWPAGPAFCIFYGPTPVSTDGLPRAYSPVNVFGKIMGDATQLTTVSSGSTIRVERKD